MTATPGGPRSAFTATLKDKTLQLFGTLQDVGGEAKYRPVHTYSMRQAIEEGFILDPLRNYVTYETYWRQQEPRRGGGRPGQGEPAARLVRAAQSRVMSAPILTAKEMDEFAEAYFSAQEKAAGSQAKWEKLHAELYRLLSPADARFVALQESDDEDDQKTAEDFRADLNDYVRKYSFLAQIVPYQDAERACAFRGVRETPGRCPVQDSDPGTR